MLDLQIDSHSQDSEVRFEILRGTERVSQGAIRLGPGGRDSFEIKLAAPSTACFPPVESLVPHAPPARLIRSILAADAQGLTGLAEIPADSPFAANGRAPAYLGLEAAAQGAAALEALGRSNQSGPRIGYLVGIRDARLHTTSLPANQLLRFTVRLTGSAPPLSIYEIVMDGAQGEELLRGTISTFLAG